MGKLTLLFLILSLAVAVLCTTVVEEKESTETEPTNNPTKVFIRRRIFRKLVKSNNGTTTTSTTEPAPTSRARTLYSLLKKSDGSVTSKTLKSQPAVPSPKFNFQRLKSQLGMMENKTEASSNSSLVMIPLPPNQRKPYTPVIMQVSRTTASTPTVQTFKLNKMFVPIGIYGQVVENATSTRPNIKHKGTDSKEAKSLADDVDITYGKPKIERFSITTNKPDVNLISITNSPAEHMFTQNHVRRGDNEQITSNSGLRLMSPPSLGGMSATAPARQSIVDSITDSVSRIPSLFHKGLTSLASMTSGYKENPFVDENFSMSQYKPLVASPTRTRVPASVPGGFIDSDSSDSTISALNDYEALEYFRKRPHLLEQLKKTTSSYRVSKGFKPVSAPEHLAKEYYRTTNPPKMSKNQRSAKMSWLLRNSNEFVANSNDKIVKKWNSLFDTFSKVRDPQSTLSNRRSEISAQWSLLKRKYSDNQIKEAKERILNILDGYGEDALLNEELQAHMPPPPKHRALGAFHDLIKFFKLGVNVGTGHSHEHVPYDTIEAQQDAWKPIRTPLISFSAGISLKTPNLDAPHYSPSPEAYDHHNVVTEELESEPPYQHAYKSKPVLDLDAGYELDGTVYKPEHAPEPEHAAPEHTYKNQAQDESPPDYDSEGEYSNVKDLHPSDSTWNPINSNDYELIPSDVYLKAKDSYNVAAVVKPEGMNQDVINGMLPTNLKNLPTLNYPNQYAFDSLNTLSNVLKTNPTGNQFKAAMKKLRDNYVAKENEYLPQQYAFEQPQKSYGFNSAFGGLDAFADSRGIPDSAALRFADAARGNSALRFASTQGLPDNAALRFASTRGLPDNSALRFASTQGLPDNAALRFASTRGLSDNAALRFADASRFAEATRSLNPSLTHNSGLRYSDVLNGKTTLLGLTGNYGSIDDSVRSFNYNPAISHSRPTQVTDELGFSEYKLPRNLDPDIASILKSELDKDDIPEDVRNEFLEAKKEEQAKKQAAAASRRVDIAQTELLNNLLSYNAPSRAIPRVIPTSATRFFAPIPITPTLMTAVGRNPRINSPVPKYVIELARKLQSDKSVQGIVRVSAKRGRGLPPIEYLYPVKG